MPTSAAQRKPATFPQTGVAARRAIRSSEWTGPTSGMAPGYVQGNLAILPKEFAADFTRFCMLNPKPCPLLAQSEPGDPRLPTLGEDLDIRTDIPLYRVWKKGELVEEVEPGGPADRAWLGRAFPIEHRPPARHLGHQRGWQKLDPGRPRASERFPDTGRLPSQLVEPGFHHLRGEAS